MCRFVLYMGPPITLDLLTTRPEHSVIHQSFKSRLRDEPLNGDGFGLAWYVPRISRTPALFRSIQPAWNNVNLLHLARVSVSPVILAHVRAATPGFSVSETNCHPFIDDRYAFAHNGSVACFKQIKRKLRTGLSDDAYHWIHGSTDSEHLFALFREHMFRLARDEPHEAETALADALEATLHDIEEMTEDAGATYRSLLNIAVTDGRRAAVSRYATMGAEAPSLYVRVGSSYVCHEGVCQMIDDDGRHATVLVASEPLTAEEGWQVVPPNHLLVIDGDHRLEMRPITGHAARR